MNRKISHRCAKCGAQRQKHDLFRIDNQDICAHCLYGEHSPFLIYPIGFVINQQKRSPRHFGLCHSSSESEIQLFASQEEFTYKLEDEEKITVIYYLHQARPIRSVFRRGWDNKKVGVFSSRTPDRLSKIGIQDVRLIKKRGTRLWVEGLDAIDGTPVLDIKMSWK